MSQSASPDSSSLQSPLGLTVHSLPDPSQGDVSTRTRWGRWKMFLVMLICAAPVMASYFTYYVVRPDGRRNFGDLIEPQRPLPTWEVAQSLPYGGKFIDKTITLSSLRGQWLLVSVGSGACDKACAHTLYLQRQLHTSLGKESDRLDRVWIVTDEAPIDTILRSNWGEVTVLRIPAAQLATWLQPQSGKSLQDHLYLVDPIGNWMMRFAPQLDLAAAAKVKRDLERVMRASAFWDTAGRNPPKPATAAATPTDSAPLAPPSGGTAKPP